MVCFQGVKNFGGHLRVWWAFPPVAPQIAGPVLIWKEAIGQVAWEEAEAEPLLAIMLEQLGTSHFLLWFQWGLSEKTLFVDTSKVSMYLKMKKKV